MTSPVILAHRGLANEAPENTLAAFRLAFERGLGIETDLQLSADGEIVVIHDTSVDRTTDGSGPVADLTVVQLQKLGAGSWFDVQYHTEGVPTLDQLLDLARSYPTPRALLCLELKAVGPGMVEELCALIAQRSLFDRVLGIGLVFREEKLRRHIKTVDPRFPTANLADTAADWPAALDDDSADWIYTRFVPNRAQVAQAHASGKRVLASAAPVMKRNPENWLAVREAGVDALITDYPEACQDLYGELR